MPGIEVEEGHEEVEADRGESGDDHVGEEVVSEIELVVSSELHRDDPERAEERVGHDDAVDDHACHVHSFRSLWTITHGQDELHHDQQDTDVSQDVEDDCADVVSERIDSLVGERASDEVEGQVEVAKREEREEQIDELVDELDVQEQLACNRMIGLPDLCEMEKRVDGSEEGTVQPATTL